VATKDVSDVEVLRAYRDWRADPRCHHERWPYDLLVERTGQPLKVCYRAMERADRRGLIDYGVSLRTGWLTPEGAALLSAALGEAVHPYDGRPPRET
jgi:hypothetical protein